MIVTLTETLCPPYDQYQVLSGPNRVTFQFTFDGGDDFMKQDIRIKKDGDFMGCIGDLGWYCVRMALLVFTSCDASALLRGTITAAQVTRFQLNDEGVPIDADCIVNFSEVRCAFIS